MRSKEIERLMQEPLELTAKKNGVSVEEVKFEIQKLIDDASDNADPVIRAFWMSIPHEGAKPTPEEVIFFLAQIGSSMVS